MTLSNRNKLLVLFLILIVCLPRFDRNDFLMQEIVGSDMENDSMQYVAMTDAFKGETPQLVPTAPFTYRTLVPYLASLLPLPSITAIDVINILVLWLGTILLGQILLRHGLNQRDTLLILATFVVSFPVFYYGAIGYVDTAFIGLLAIGCYLIERKFDLLLIALLFVGVFVKEIIILILPVYFLQGLVQKRGVAYTVTMTALLFFACLAGVWLARKFSSDQATYTWEPNMNRFLDNVHRIRTWISFFLSAGLPCALSVVAIVVTLYNKNWPLLWRMFPWVAGIGGSVALFLYSLLTAYSDGRFIWPATVFAIPLLGIFFMEYKNHISRITHSKVADS